ncbi:hypothetical protein RMSM_02286 [Rhodopirellula maiorica SM1]|uniref:Uncharacterized protein n=1 Tax=Rhodopirellula maiorica SM1 TaxID=1265738 RepID=M5RZI0_9BACT|nr:hypothetical protein RMSM_02286 [Rhodopirellula maiorica SM1]
MGVKSLVAPRIRHDPNSQIKRKKRVKLGTPLTFKQFSQPHLQRSGM